MGIDPISLGLEFVGKIADKIWPDPTAKAAGLLELEKLHQNGELAVLANDTELQRISASDRDSARKREMEVRDRMPSTLGILVTVGFFGVVGYLLGYGAPDKGGEVLYMMLGSLGTAWTGIISYYFGSTAGSAAKNSVIATMAKSKD